MSVAAEIKHWVDDVRGVAVYHRFGEKERRRNRLLSQFMAMLTFISATYYIGWCAYHANWEAWYAFVPFMIAEMGFAFMLLLWVAILWNKRHHRPAGITPKTSPSVDVYIPVVREPLDIVERTVLAATKIDYPKFQVHVLDDGGSDLYKELAERHGVNYIRRPTHENRKAGNMNYAMKQTSNDLILVLDADQVAQPDILTHLMGYFDLPHVGFVQTSQRFQLPKDDPWGNADNVFYKAMQTAKDFDNAAISCGSGVIYRRKALENIGGFSEWNVVEDLHTSLQMHSKGWHSVFHDTAYTTGTAPADVMSQVKQRWQWAVDSLRMIFWDSPLRYKGLSWPQRLQYYHFGFNYIAFGICLPIFLILPIWALFSHTFVLPPPFYLYVFARAPYLLSHMLTNRLITYHQHSFKSFQAQAGMFPTYIDAIITALLSRKKVPAYTVTNKRPIDTPFGTRLFKCLPHILISAFALAALIYGYVNMENDAWFFVINGAWCIWTILVLNRFIRLSLRGKVAIA